MDTPMFVYVTYIATTPQKLWEALTSSDIKSKYWFGMHFEGQTRVGGTYKATDADGIPVAVGEMLEVDPPRRLAYTFQPQDERVRNEKTTRVTFEIEPAGKQVRLTVTHDQFKPDSNLIHGVAIFWPKLLSSLKSFLETGSALEITSAARARDH